MKEAEARILEMREFAAFTPTMQRYICRSIDVFRGIKLRLTPTQRWARNLTEETIIDAQTQAYWAMSEGKRFIPESHADWEVREFFTHTIEGAIFDVWHGQFTEFDQFRFLYERLLGAGARPWLPMLFVAARLNPGFDDDYRREVKLGDFVAVKEWPKREPTFFPEWIEKDKE